MPRPRIWMWSRISPMTKFNPSNCIKKSLIAKLSGFIVVPEAGLEPARPNGHRILSPACLPIPPLGHPWSEKRDSNPRPRPWQGRALPTELFSQFCISPNLVGVLLSVSFALSAYQSLFLKCGCKYRGFFFISKQKNVIFYRKNGGWELFASNPPFYIIQFIQGFYRC